MSRPSSAAVVPEIQNHLRRDHITHIELVKNQAIGPEIWKAASRAWTASKADPEVL